MDDKARIAELERKLTHLYQRLDAVFRANGWPPLIDEQLAAINARQSALARGQAA